MKEKRINHRVHRGKINSLCSQRQPLAESVTKSRKNHRVHRVGQSTQRYNFLKIKRIKIFSVLLLIFFSVFSVVLTQPQPVAKN